MNDEKIVKRWLKRKMSYTLSLLITFLMTGMFSFSADKTWSTMTSEEKIEFLHNELNSKVRGDNVIFDTKTSNYDSSRGYSYGTNVLIGDNNKPLVWIKDDGTPVSGNHRVMLGYNNQSVHNSFTLGDSNYTLGSQSLGLGYQTYGMGHDSIAIGAGANALVSTEMKNLGYGSRDFQARNVAVGENAVSAPSSSAYGSSSAALGKYSLALGTQAIAGGANADGFTGDIYSLNSAAKASITDAEVKETYKDYLKNIDFEKFSSYEQSNILDRLRSTMYVEKTPAVAATAIGTFSRAKNNYGVALGATSVSDREAFSTSTKAPYSNFELNNTNTLGAVSVGNATHLRQITNLADGTEDTDAVNLRQLKAVAENGGSKVEYFSVNSTEEGNKDNKGATIIGAESEASDSIAIGPNAYSSAHKAVAIGLNAQSNSEQSVAIGSGSKANYGINLIKSLDKQGKINARGANSRVVALGNDNIVTGVQSGSYKDSGYSQAIGSSNIMLGANASSNIGTGNSGVNSERATMVGTYLTNVASKRATTIGASSRTFSSNESISMGGYTFDFDAGELKKTQVFTSNAGIALGAGASLFESDNSVATGKFSQVDASADAVAIGTKSKINNSDNAVALGKNTVAGVNDSVALGSNSVANVDRSKVSYVPEFATEEALFESLSKDKQWLEGVNNKISTAKTEMDNSAKELETATTNKKKAIEDALEYLAESSNFKKEVGNLNDKTKDELLALQKKYGLTDEKYNALIDSVGKYSESLTKYEQAKEKYNTALTEKSDAISEELKEKGFVSTLGAVSVGTEKEKRQITNVAGGTEDTDAVNVAQLKGAVKLTKDLQNATGLTDEEIEKINDPNATDKPKTLVERINELSNSASNAITKYYGVSSTSDVNLKGDQAQGRDVVVIGPGNTMPADIDGKVVKSYDTTVIGSNNKLELIRQNGDKFTLGNYTISNVLVGNKNKSLGYTNVIVGESNNGYGSDGTVIGNGNTISGQRAIAIGNYAKALGADAIAQGFAAKALDSAVSIGGYSKAEVSRGVSIGNGAVTTKASGVALGSGSLANRGSGYYAYVPNYEKELKTEEDIAEYLGVQDKYNELKAKVEANSAVKQKYNEYLTAVNERSEADKKVQEEKTKIFTAKTKEEKQKVLDNLAVLQKDYDEKRKVELEKQDAYYKDPKYKEYQKDSAELSELLSTMRSSSSAVSVGNSETGLKRQITNVAGGTEDSDAVNVAQLKAITKMVKDSDYYNPISYIDENGNTVSRGNDGKFYKTTDLDEKGDPKENVQAVDEATLHHSLVDTKGKPNPSVLSNVDKGVKDTDAVNVSQLKDAIKKLDDLYEDKTDKDGNPVDEKGNPLVKGEDGKYYPKNEDGTANTENGPVEPAQKLKGLKFVGNVDTEEYKKTLGEEVKILGNTNVEEAKRSDYSVTNVLTENTKDGLLIKMSDKPLFKEVVVKDGEEGPETNIKPGNVTVTNGKDGKDGKSSSLTPEGMEVKDGKDGENGKAVYGKDGISITGAKGADGADGKTTVIKVDKDGDVVIAKDGKDGKDGKVITQQDLDKIVGTNGKDGVSGKDGANGTDGAAGKDGLNGKDGKTPANLTDKVDALRRGEAGPVVYTDKDGNRVVKGTDGKFYKPEDLDENDKPKTGVSEVLPENIKHSLVSADGTTTGTPSQIGNVAEGTKDTDAVNLKQLKDMVSSSTTGNNDLYEGDENNRKLKGIKFVGNQNTEEYKKTLGEEVKILGNANVEDSKKADYSVTNILTENTKDALLIKMSDKPLFKEVVVKDGEEGPETNIKPGNVTVTNGKDGKDGKSSSLTLEGMEVKDGKDGENGKAVYGKDGISITGAKGADGADGKTTVIKVDKDGNVVIGKDGKDGKVITEPDLIDKINASKVELKDGKNTTVEKDATVTDHTVYKVNVSGDLADISSISNGATKLTLGKDNNELNVNNGTITNVAAGKNDTDAVNVSQLKEATKDLYEDKTDKDGNPVDEKGNPLVKGEDGKYYPKNPDGTANTENGPVEPAKSLKGLKFVGNVDTEEYKKTLGEEVKILGNTNVEEAKRSDYSVTNVLTENTKDGLLIKMSDKPLFKEVVVKDGEEGPETNIKPGNVTVTNGKDGKDGKSSSLTPEGMEVKDGKDGENGKAVYGKDGISITGAKGADGADGKTTVIKVDKDGNVVIGKDGKDGKVVTQPDLTDALNGSRLELVNGKNTTVEKDATVTDHTVYKVNVSGDLADISSISNGATKLTFEKDKNELNVNNGTITNVAAGKNDTDAVNVKQLKDMIASSTTGNNDLYEGDEANRKLKGLSFVGNVNTGEYKKTLGEEVKILGNTSNTVKAADFSVTNVLTENTKDGLLIKMSDKPLFKEIVVKDGENGPSTTIKPGDVTVTNGKDGKDGKSSSFNPEGFEIKDGKDGENGKAFYGKDGISITGAKGKDGADGKTTVIKVDKDGDVVIGKEGKDGNKVVTKDELDKITGGMNTNVTDRLNSVENRADQALSGVSTAIAMANLPQVSANGDHRKQISAGVGIYGGESAIAVGFSGLSKQEKLVYKVSGSMNTRGNLAFGVGLGYNFDRKDNFETRESDSLKERLEKLEKENQEMRELLNQILQKNK